MELKRCWGLFGLVGLAVGDLRFVVIGLVVGSVVVGLVDGLVVDPVVGGA